LRSAVTGCKTIDVKENTIRDRTAEGSEFLIQAKHGGYETERKIRVANVTERGKVWNDATLENQSSGVANAKAPEQLFHSRERFFEFRFYVSAYAIRTEIRKPPRDIFKIEDDENQIRFKLSERAVWIQQLIRIRAISSHP
jgi:hypothetical protein